MVLVDTSVWVDHFRSGNSQLVKLLNDGDVICHPFIIGELACGNIKNRKQILSLLLALPTAMQASHQEILEFIEIKKLTGKGLGYIDVHLLGAAFLSNAALWSRDKKLNAISLEFKVGFK
ncbi:MAG: type II toxin-antitoxin system VapC family toxin [Candidatus Scalindua sp.]